MVRTSLLFSPCPCIRCHALLLVSCAINKSLRARGIACDHNHFTSLPSQPKHTLHNIYAPDEKFVGKSRRLTRKMADKQAQSTNFKEAFSLFDKRGNGRVPLDSLGDLLRACGQNPTLAEIRDLEQSVGGDCKHNHKYPSTYKFSLY